jgi:hypothetical protein
MSDLPRIVRMDTDYYHVRWSSECWAQFPVDFGGDMLPDEYIFNPGWHRERINAWWLSTGGARHRSLVIQTTLRKREKPSEER